MTRAVRMFTADSPQNVRSLEQLALVQTPTKCQSSQDTDRSVP